MTKLMYRLNEYNTALEVRKAKEQGRVQGREEVSNNTLSTDCADD